MGLEGKKGLRRAQAGDFGGLAVAGWVLDGSRF
jgi:hypothetical protein